MSRRKKIYEGKAKILYEGPEPGTIVQYFKDDATAFNAEKKDVFDGKGVLNNRISEHIFQNLNSIGVPTHFIKRINMREQLIKEVEIIPIEVVVRNMGDAARAGYEGNEALIKKLARIEVLSEVDDFPKGCVTIPVEGGSFGLPLADIIDIKEEKVRLQKSLDKLNKELGGLRGRLNNPKFAASAPEDVVAETRSNLVAREEEEATLKDAMARLEELG